MNLGSLCQRHVITVDRHDSLQRAAHQMRDQHVGALVVTDDTPEGRRVVGLVTDRDLALAVLADGGMAPQRASFRSPLSLLLRRHSKGSRWLDSGRHNVGFDRPRGVV